MAVVQISKIQVRRGQRNQGSGLPQLASGELGWAIDTQELFIGNGAVAEGAPQVGNTKVITQHDDLFSLADAYVYRNGSAVTTGIDSSNPVERTLQERLDDRVSIKAFGATGNASQDATSLIQRALDQLYLNAGQEVSESNRVKLHLEAGIYTIKDTLRIPPHATIIGAGANKTIIKQENANRSVFTTVSDESRPGAYVLDGDYATQARNIRIEGVTLQSTADSKGLVLQSCRDSYFENITILGPWITGNPISSDTTTTNSIGLSLNSKNGGVESVRNEFTNCHIQGWAYGVVSDWDINDNVWTTSNFGACGYGVSFGKSMVVDGNEANGTASGPHNNIFSDCVFTNISRQAIYINEGTYNVSRGNKYITCGNDGGADNVPVYSILKFETLGNESINDFFTRTKALSYTQENLQSVVYVPEVEGPCNFEWGFEHRVTITDGIAVPLFRLPSVENQSFFIDYLAVSEEGYNGVRSGRLEITVNDRADVGNGTPGVAISDEYTYKGDNSYLDTIALTGVLLDVDADTTFDTVLIRTDSVQMSSNSRTKFKFKVRTKKSDI